MTARVRGNALPETALVMALVLLLLSAAIQTAMAAYVQVSADGAAFASAHSTVQHYGAPNAATDPTVTTLAQTIAHSIFSHIKTTDVAVKNPDNASLETTVTEHVSGFTLLPGSPATFTVTGRDVEAQQPIGPTGGNLLGFQNLPKLPGSTTNCPSLTGSSSLLGTTGANLAANLSAISSQSSNLNKVLGDFDGLLTPINNVLGGTSFATNVTSSVTGAVSAVLTGPLLMPLVSQVTALLVGPTGPVGSVVTSVLQTVVNQAIAGVAPTQASITSMLVTPLITALNNTLGPVLGLLLSSVVTPLANAIAANLVTTIFNPLITPLTKIAGDHSLTSTLLNGSCAAS
jgi:hypothetical protein